MSRMQLINMCKYMGIPPYGADALLRFQLRHKVKSLKEDDQRILWEGIESLTKQELREACRERGMRSTGLKKEEYKKALQEWLDISVNRHVPVTLLIMSRTFFLQDPQKKPKKSQEETTEKEEKSMVEIADAISGFEKGVLNEVVLEAVAKEEDPDYIKLKLESLKTQNELIDEEYEIRQNEKLEKERLEKEEKEREEKEKELAAAAAAEKTDVITEEKNVAEAGIEERKEMTIDDTKPIIEPTTSDEKAIQPSPEEEEEEEEFDLSTQEMEAISQLISPNAVTIEREEFERLKAAMSSADEEEKEADEEIDDKETDKKVIQMEEPAKEDEDKLKVTVIVEKEKQEKDGMDSETADAKAAKIISDMDAQASKVADESTFISLDGKEKPVEEEDKSLTAPEEVLPTDEEEEEERDTKLDKSISRLKSRVEAMVGKIERQLTDVEKKIGDRLHLLDKDSDGVISVEEMTVCLRSVLKRNLTEEEVMAIVDDMDENEDGAITVAELALWIDTNKFVKLAEEGRDAELDREIEKKMEKKEEQQHDDVSVDKDDHVAAKK